jgi:hypothetical protein
VIHEKEKRRFPWFVAVCAGLLLVAVCIAVWLLVFRGRLPLGGGERASSRPPVQTQPSSPPPPPVSQGSPPPPRFSRPSRPPRIPGLRQPRLLRPLRRLSRLPPDHRRFRRQPPGPGRFLRWPLTGFPPPYPEKGRPTESAGAIPFGTFRRLFTAIPGFIPGSPGLIISATRISLSPEGRSGFLPGIKFLVTIQPLYANNSLGGVVRNKMSIFFERRGCTPPRSIKSPTKLAKAGFCGRGSGKAVTGLNSCGS